MSASNPQMEWFTIWGYTQEEILHRWDIWKKFDIVTRIFGGNDKKVDEPKTPVNTEATFAALANLFGPNFMQQTPTEG